MCLIKSAFVGEKNLNVIKMYGKIIKKYSLRLVTMELKKTARLRKLRPSEQDYTPFGSVKYGKFLTA
jgi:hypothetical protein